MPATRIVTTISFSSLQSRLRSHHQVCRCTSCRQDVRGISPGPSFVNQAEPATLRGRAPIEENLNMRLISPIHFLAVLVILVAFCGAQSSTASASSPRKVVEKFWEMEMHGGRLTEEGWRAADSYFVRPTEPPNEKVIGVVDNEFSIENPFTRSDNTAVVTINVHGRTWRIDPKMQIKISSDQVKGFLIYELVLTSKHWEFTADRRTLREVTGTPEWRMKDEGGIWVTRDTAIRYLRQVRDGDSSAVLKNNAEQSLKVLEQRNIR